jgi:DNA polymerase-4
MNRIFYDYTDLVEPFGVDESWLDVTGSLKLFGSGKDIADSIRKRVHEELGITVSVGVSFNKVFAKLGSDLKKPNATSVIPPDKFASVIWHLPVSYLLFVGPSCARTLSSIGVKTIGDLACCDENILSGKLGKNGKFFSIIPFFFRKYSFGKARKKRYYAEKLCARTRFCGGYALGIRARAEIGEQRNDFSI